MYLWILDVSHEADMDEAGDGLLQTLQAHNEGMGHTFGYWMSATKQTWMKLVMACSRLSRPTIKGSPCTARSNRTRLNSFLILTEKPGNR